MSPSMLERWRHHGLLLREGSLWDGTRAWPDFAAWCNAHSGGRCRLWLSSALLHELVCDPGLPLADDAAALAWARPLLQHYHGDAALAWPLAAWQQGRQRGVSALHGASLDTLRSSAQQAGVRLLAVKPWWSLQLQQALRQHRALRGPQARLLIAEDARVAVLGLERGRLTQLELRRLDPQADDKLAPWRAEDTTPTLLLGRNGPGPLDTGGSDWLSGAPA